MQQTTTKILKKALHIIIVNTLKRLFDKEINFEMIRLKIIVKLTPNLHCNENFNKIMINVLKMEITLAFIR